LCKAHHQSSKRRFFGYSSAPLGGALQDNALPLERDALGDELRLSRNQCHDEVEEMM
jgi:hypothetical protein